MEKFNYNKGALVGNYKLITHDEYGLLPYEVRMAYCDEKYGYAVKEAKEKGYGDGLGYIYPSHAEYFKANGCSYENFDFGSETYEVKSVFDATYEVSEEAKNKLEYYRNLVGLVKFEIFEQRYIKHYNEVIEAIHNGKSVILNGFDFLSLLNGIRNKSLAFRKENLTADEQELLMRAELQFVLKAIDNNEEYDIADYVPQDYKDYIENYKLSKGQTKKLN